MNKIGQRKILDVGYAASRPPIEVLSLAELRARAQQDRGRFLRPQRVDFDLMLTCHHGTLQHTVDFVEYVLSPGDVLWVRAGQVQEWQWFDRDITTAADAGAGDTAATLVLFEPTSLDERARALGGSAPKRTLWPAATVEGSPGRRRLDDLIATAARSLPRPFSDELVARLLGLLVVELALHDQAGTDPPGPSDDLFAELSAAIDAHFADTRTTGDYARRLGYSARTINRRALRNTGLTVKQLVDRRALLEAKRLLAHDTAPVHAVGRAVGFSEPTAFNRFFRHRTGITPLEFRNGRRGTEATLAGPDSIR